MQNKNLINLNVHQKSKGALILFLMYIVLVALYVINASTEVFLQNVLKSIMILVLLLLLTATLYFYLVTFAQKFINEIKYTVLLSLLFLITLQLNMLFAGNVAVYARPLFVYAMLMTVLIGKQHALFLNVYFMLVLYLFDVYSGGFVFADAYAVYSLVCTLGGGTLAIIFTSKNKRRFDTVMSAFGLGILSMLFGLAVYILFNGVGTEVFFIALASYLSAHFSLLLHMGILPIFERWFNIITNYRLDELTDHNRALLKQMSAIAPGTFNHSLAVGNLAEACALAIGENTQLARTAAYYHDVGKIKNPMYFKENQDDYNPHDDITPELSANFIKKHTVEGYNLCRKYRLPNEIADICLEHHGTTVIKYFYYKAKKFTDGDLSTKPFRYDGPKPRSKIAAIIMIADAAEAAIRVLEDRKKSVVEEKVKEIIDERMDLEQFSDCDITMRDLYTIIEQIVKISAGIYHDRTEYPKIKFSREETQSGEEKTDTDEGNEGSI